MKADYSTSVCGSPRKRGRAMSFEVRKHRRADEKNGMEKEIESNERKQLVAARDGPAPKDQRAQQHGMIPSICLVRHSTRYERKRRTMLVS
jgi:hypothetical protein